MNHRYPLKPLLFLRQEIKQLRERSLANAVIAYQDAETSLKQEHQRLETKIQSVQQVRTHYQTEQKEIRDLQNFSLYLKRLEAEVQQMQELVQIAESTYQQKKLALKQSQTELLQAESELKAVEKHYESWNSEQRRKAEKRAEEELAELTDLKFRLKDPTEE